MLKYSILLLMMVTQLVMADDENSYLKAAKKVGDHVWIGAQPTAQDFDELAAEEIGAVISTRTMAEMKQLDFNEVEQASKFNMTYDLLEIGKGHAYSPAKLEEFNALMTANKDKKMVLHCRSGHRASQLYAAWLIKYQGKSDAEALQAIGSDETELNDSVTALLGK
ncbi:MAG: fused DSP-PTPase phosphatase/NAD kinase-like protein [Marinicella sp.]